MPCPDFENKHVKADSLKLGLTPGDGDEPDSFGLNGFLNLSVPIDADLDVSTYILPAYSKYIKILRHFFQNYCTYMFSENIDMVRVECNHKERASVVT